MMPPANNEKRTRTQWEPRLVSEWVALTYPDRRAFFNLSVGPIPQRILDQDLTPGEIRALGAARPRADAVIVDGARLVVVEAWLVPDLGKVGKLANYVRLVPSTPELAGLKQLTVYGTLLGPWDHDVLRADAVERGFSFVIFRPSWINEALAARGQRLRENKVYGL